MVALQALPIACRNQDPCRISAPGAGGLLIKFQGMQLTLETGNFQSQGINFAAIQFEQLAFWTFCFFLLERGFEPLKIKVILETDT